MTMDPNSPRAREKARAVPVSKGGSRGGSNTCLAREREVNGQQAGAPD